MNIYHLILPVGIYVLWLHRWMRGNFSTAEPTADGQRWSFRREPKCQKGSSAIQAEIDITNQLLGGGPESCVIDSILIEIN